jgi:nitrogen-specific signal transduction histidine kinase
MLECIQVAAALADTLDELAAAILLLDANAIILHANAAARAMLSDGDLLQQPPMESSVAGLLPWLCATF